jgi:C1A family cysteine protease
MNKIPFKLVHRMAKPSHSDFIFERKFGTVLPAQTISIKEQILTDGFQIGNQGSEGNCYAWAGKGAKESEIILSGQPYIQLSAQSLSKFTKEVMGEQFNEDDGADNLSLFLALRKYGVCTETLLSSDISTMSIPLTSEQIANALLYKNNWYYRFKSINGYANALNLKLVPVIGFTVFPSIMNTGSDGIVPMPSNNEQPEGGHDQFIVGVDFEEGYIETANSWGTDFGNKGFLKWSFEYCSLYSNDPYCGAN